MSFGYVDKNDDVCASIVSIPYDEMPAAMIDEETDRTRPVMSLIYRLGDKYKPIDPLRATYAFMMGVDDRHSGKQLGSNLIRETISDSMKKNMRELIADCTGNASQHILKKFGGVVVAEERYSDFEYLRTKSFDVIDVCESAKRIVINLS